MRFVVTGGLGFIGSCLVQRLLELSHTVCIVDRRNVEVAIAKNPLIKSWISSFLDNCSSNKLINAEIEGLDLSFLADYDVIVHLAANPGVQLSVTNPLQDLKANLLNSITILESIRSLPESKRPSLVFSSSAAPLAGNTTFPLHENLPLKPLSPYGASKSACESYICAYNNSFNLNCTVLRFSNVYGPGSLAKSSVVSNMIKSALQKNTISINGSGLQTRDFIYIEDLVESIIHASLNPYLQSPVHLSTGEQTTILDVAEQIKSSLTKYIANTPSITFSSALTADAVVNYSSPTLLQQLGFPLFRPFSSDLIDRTVKYFIDHLSLL